MQTIRSETEQDHSAIHAIHRTCFPSAGEANVVDQLRQNGLLSISLVAVQPSGVVGHVAFSPVRAAYGAAGMGLAPVAVLPAYQRRGIAAALITRGLDEGRRLGVGWVVVLGDPAYYGRFGFSPASEFGLSDAYGGGSAFQVLELIPGNLPYGAGLVAYAPAFADLE